MEMFSRCVSKCDTCYISFVGGCLAGHGDDDYTQMTLERAKKALSNNWVNPYMKEKLFKLFPELNAT